MAELDENKDGEVDFHEFMTMVGTMTTLCGSLFAVFDGLSQEDDDPAEGEV